MFSIINKSKICILGIILISFFCSCHSPGDAAINVDKQPQVYNVEIKGMKFIPEELTINSGDMVVFTNKDMVVHDITADPDRSWSSKPLAVDSSWQKVFITSQDYFCSIHPVMKGKILVR